MLVPRCTHLPIKSQLLKRLSVCGKRGSGDFLSFFFIIFPSQDTEQMKTAFGTAGPGVKTHTYTPLPDYTGHWLCKHLCTAPLVPRECSAHPTGLISDWKGHGPSSGQWVRRGLLEVRGGAAENASSLLRENPPRRQFLWTLLYLDRTPESTTVVLPSAWGKSQHPAELRGERAQFFDNHDLADESINLDGCTTTERPLL